MAEFSTKKFLEKRAFYEGAQGYSHAHGRAWCNCIRENMDGDDPSFQKAWENCWEEYQETGTNYDWALKYASKEVKQFGLKAEGDNKLGKYADAVKSMVDKGYPWKTVISHAIKQHYNEKK